MSMEQDFDRSSMDGNKKIQVPIDHRTLIIVKNHSPEVLVEICIVGGPGKQEDVLNIALAPGTGQALDVYAPSPLEYVFVRGLPVSKYEKEKQDHRTNLLRRPNEEG
ncbi:MAG TPA: hypothetical protein VN939_00800 [Chthoniobacterales bacterium]|jgi:hypothetical protein|nr:hypothetical protein [Chthoniobacterales bacterium]